MLPRLFTRCVLIIGCVCFSSLALSNPLTYITYPDGVGITGCVDSSCPSEIIVPEMIDSKKVTRIEENAFCDFNNYNNPELVKLPNTIKHIGVQWYATAKIAIKYTNTDTISVSSEDSPVIVNRIIIP